MKEGDAGDEDDDDPGPVAEVLEIALASTWMRLAIEKYQSGGGKLTYLERSALLRLTEADLEKLKRERASIRGKRPGQDRQESGWIY